MYAVSLLKKTRKKLIIVKLDQIGDYVLFRNFLAVLKDSPEYRHYELTLLGNKECRDLAESLDKNVVDRFLWLDKQRYAKWKFCRKRFHAKLKGLHFDVLVSPLFSRENCWTEPVVQAISADEKIGSVGDLTNITAAHRFIANDNYTRLIPARKGVVFEFLRNKEFFEHLLGCAIDIKGPRIIISPSTRPIQDRYAVLFPGATGKYRRWAEERFAETAGYLYQRHGLKSVICGSDRDRALGRRIVKPATSKHVIDLSGKTALGELPVIFHGAHLLITNDTSAHHIAAAVGTRTICLSNGNTFGRFVPYPPEISEAITYAYPSEIEQNLHSFDDLVEKYGYASRLDMNLVSVDRVKSLIDECLRSRSGAKAGESLERRPGLHG